MFFCFLSSDFYDILLFYAPNRNFATGLKGFPSGILAFESFCNSKAASLIEVYDFKLTNLSDLHPLKLFSILSIDTSLFFWVPTGGKCLLS
jgi:hypothetical protein